MLKLFTGAHVKVRVSTWNDPVDTASLPPQERCVCVHKSLSDPENRSRMTPLNAAHGAVLNKTVVGGGMHASEWVGRRGKYILRSFSLVRPSPRRTNSEMLHSFLFAVICTGRSPCRRLRRRFSYLRIHKKAAWVGRSNCNFARYVGPGAHKLIVIYLVTLFDKIPW